MKYITKKEAIEMIVNKFSDQLKDHLSNGLGQNGGSGVFYSYDFIGNEKINELKNNLKKYNDIEDLTDHLPEGFKIKEGF